jgi:molybdenum cofactor cytidylyltransferase
MKLGVVILAAGAASRIGFAKMLLPYAGQTILGHIIQEVQALHPVRICLVTGKYTDEIQTSLGSNSVDIVPFVNWQAGMAASIQFGMDYLMEKEPNLDTLLFVVSDQPFLERQLLFRMIDAFQQSGKGIVAAKYQEQFGTPVLFHSKYIPQIKKLEGDRGAKKILEQHLDDLVLVDFPLGEFDIDTVEDYSQFQLLLKQENAH